MSSTASPVNDPCYNYTVLDQPWRATNQSADYVCDAYFQWNGWYRLLYNGMSIRMPESCVSGCSTADSLYLNGAHPQLQDGIVTRQVCTKDVVYGCCSSYYSHTNIQVKACPGNFYVYEFVKPTSCSYAYCAGRISGNHYVVILIQLCLIMLHFNRSFFVIADVTTLTPTNSSVTGNPTDTNIRRFL